MGEQRTCVVTGAARGLGLACAEALAPDVTQLAVLDRDEATARAAADAIARLGVRAIAVGCDVADGRSVRAAFAQVFDELGDVDVLVNNAGIPGVARTEEQAEEEWDAIVDLRYSAHSWSGALNTAASLAFLAISPNGDVLDFKPHESPMQHDLVEDPWVQQDGMLQLRSAPGLGVTVSEAAVVRYRFD